MEQRCQAIPAPAAAYVLLLAMTIPEAGFAQEVLRDATDAEQKTALTAKEGSVPMTVEITGSRIRRLPGETALPVTVIPVETLRREGVVTAEDAVRRIAANQSVVSTNGVVGNNQAGRAEANLRGLGGNRTLVLVDGRRLANHAYTSGAADLNAIPMAAVERIEVLRDGASALYGTDAIGGVINFITRRDFQGVEVSAGYQHPQEKGGNRRDFTLTAGKGSLQADGFNFLGVIEHQQQDPLRAVDRSFAAHGVNLEHGVVKSSSTVFPANIFQLSTRVTGNPYFPACDPPESFSLPALYGATCRNDYASIADLIPDVERTNLLGRASFALGGGHTASLEYLRADNTVVMRTAALPLFGMTMTPASPYYPGNGIVPAVAGLDTSQNINLNWRMSPMGPRINKSGTVSERTVARLEGSIGGWDYETGLWQSRNHVTDAFAGGFYGLTPLQRAVRDGNPVYLNPFGQPSAEERAFLSGLEVFGRYLDANGRVTGVDAHASRQIGSTAAGPISLAVGAESRREKYSQVFNPALANDIFGLPPDVDMSVRGSRNVSALFAEMEIPLTRQLQAQLALRHDRYSDIGGTTNPKIALRYQPAKTFLLRASANRGFRAPTLYELDQPERITASPGMFNDPVLCPGGVVAAGGVPSRDCRQQMNVRTAGSNGIAPERSRTWSFGVVFEPSPTWSASLDYWNIALRDQIGALTPQAIFADTGKYAAKFVRCGDLPAAKAASIFSCRVVGGVVDPAALAYVDAANENLGNLKSDGLDLDLKYRFGHTGLGRFALGYQGTWVHHYRRQREKGGAYTENVANVVDTLPVFRWQHELSLNWSKGDWSADLVNRFKGGYRDQNDSFALIDASYANKVKRYSLWDVAATWRGMKGLGITGGVQNVFDTDPPFSNQNFLTQANYDPRVTDPRGRTFFVRMVYSF